MITEKEIERAIGPLPKTWDRREIIPYSPHTWRSGPKWTYIRDYITPTDGCVVYRVQRSALGLQSERYSDMDGWKTI